MRNSAAAGILSLIFCYAVLAQSGAEQRDLTVNELARSQVIESVLKNLNDFYVFPEVAKQMENSIRERLSRKEYDRISSAKEGVG